MPDKNAYQLTTWAGMKVALKATRLLILDMVLQRVPFGGALNGQVARQRMVIDLLNRIRPKALVETGTHKGTSTNHFGKIFGGPIYSVEISPLFYSYSRLRFAFRNRLQIYSGHSVKFLRSLHESGRLEKGPIFFYLDAHWGQTPPLREEIDFIFTSFDRPVVLIDDFAVPGDPGYRFDRYGDEHHFKLPYLQALKDKRVHVFAPSTHSTNESGGKRGCLVLCKDPDLVFALQASPHLKNLGLLSAMLSARAKRVTQNKVA